MACEGVAPHPQIHPTPPRTGKKSSTPPGGAGPLRGQIGVDPYSEDPERAVPHVSLQVFQDEWMECLGPQELGAVIKKVRAHLVALEGLGKRLVEALQCYRGFAHE